MPASRRPPHVTALRGRMTRGMGPRLLMHEFATERGPPQAALGGTRGSRQRGAGGGACSGAPTGRTPPQRRRPGASGSEHKPGVQPGGHTRPQAGPAPRRVALRPFRPVERAAEQSRQAVFNRRSGAKHRGRAACKDRDRAKHGRGPCRRPGSHRSCATSVFREAERASRGRGGRSSASPWCEALGNAVRSCGP